MVGLAVDVWLSHRYSSSAIRRADDIGKRLGSWMRTVPNREPTGASPKADGRGVQFLHRQGQNVDSFAFEPSVDGVTPAHLLACTS